MKRRERAAWSPELEELAAAESKLAERVAAVTGSMEQRHERLRAAGVFDRYSRVFRRYLALARPPRRDLEALKRASFLAWYEQAEPWCLTGVGELPLDASRRIVGLLDASLSRFDGELRWMLPWYHSIADWAYPGLESHPRLRALLTRGDPQAWRVHRAVAAQMAGRGLMGEYWLSVLDSPA